MTQNNNNNNNFTMYCIVIIVVGLIILGLGGCFASSTSSEPMHKSSTATYGPPATPSTPAFELKDVSNSIIHYGWAEVTGTLVSNVAKEHSVAIYTDFYNAQGVKIDHVLDFVSVDGYGEASFECTTTKEGATTATWYIDHIY